MDPNNCYCTRCCRWFPDADAFLEHPCQTAGKMEAYEDVDVPIDPTPYKAPKHRP